MENSNINIKPIYFNDNINNLKFLLDISDLAPVTSILDIKKITIGNVNFKYLLTESITIDNKNNPILTLNGGDIFDGIIIK